MYTGANMKASITIGLVLCILRGQTAESKNVFVAAPNVFRVGAEENIALAVDGTSNAERMEIFIQDHPGKKKNFSREEVMLFPGRPQMRTLIINSEDVEDMLIDDPNAPFYVNLVARGAGFHKEVLIPLSTKFGYMYLQTDKPIYSPKQNVQFRIISLNEHEKPSSTKLRLQVRNPKNVVVRDIQYDNKLEAKLFIIPKPFVISAYPLFGNWSATVLYGHKFKQNKTVSFQVQEYVLPTFTVKLRVPEVILPTDNTISVNFRATYLYGKPVTGIATFRLGVKGPLPDVIFFGIAASKTLIDGEYSLNVNTSDLKIHRKIGWFPTIQDYRFVVDVTVTDSATGLKEVEVDDSGIFTATPLKISFKNCLKDFKPGLMTIIEADLTYVNSRPASGIPTVLTGTANGNLPLSVSLGESISNKEGRVQFHINTEIHHTVINIEVSTVYLNMRDIPAIGYHKLEKFTSRSNAYIALNKRSSEKLQPGSAFSEGVYNVGAPMTDIYYLIVTRGRIIMFEKLPSGQFRDLKVSFTVTHEMVPSFRLMVFGHHNGELLADSHRMEVNNECRPDANVEVNLEFPNQEPGVDGKIILRGNKGTSVGLLGVDSGVYALSNQGLLSKSKMFKTLENHDLGCGPGGGSTTDAVLGNAGVVILSNLYTPPQLSESSCRAKIRKKRQLVSAKLDKYTGRLRECCALGMKNYLDAPSCEIRTEMVKNHLEENDKNCSQVFFECCSYSGNKAIGGPRQSMRIGTIALMRSSNSVDVLDEEDEIEIERNINVRREFRETWIFSDYIIGPNGQTTVELSLPHSITTWMLQAVSLSPNNGMCVIEPKELKVMKKVFVQLNLPYSVVRNEQIEIKATVFNYGSKRLSAVIYLYGVKGICSGTEEGMKSERKRLIIDAYSAETVYFPIIPLKAGNYDIKVAALTPDVSDIVIRQLNVVPEGYPVERHITIALDPSNQQKRDKRSINGNGYSDDIDPAQKLQVTSIKLRIPEESIPGTESCVISALGDQFGPTVETCLENPDKLLSGPRGCAEQNMIFFAPTMYAMRYLKATGKITADQEEKGYELIRKGYTHQLSFRKNDGSFGAYITTPSSIWLTAFVTRVFCQASELIYIDVDTMCAGVAWLVSKQKPEDGSFQENHPVYHLDLMGGVKGKGPLTAYILLTLQTCKCNIDTTSAKDKAVEYLESILDTLNDPLAISIVAYALSLSSSEFKYKADFKLLNHGKLHTDTNTLHWSGHSSAASIEATSYALLTQLQHNDMDKSNSIVNWLNTQRYSSGKFQSTQDTIVALHALSEYAMKAKLPGINLLSNLTASNDRNFYKTLKFHGDNAQVLQEVKVDKPGGFLFVHTAGHGVGFLSVKLRYNIPTPPEKLCKFDITVNVSEAKEKEPVHGGDIFGPLNVDHFDLFPQDLIRLDTIPDKAPEDIKYEINPRNRPQRISRISDIKGMGYEPLRKLPAQERMHIRSKREDKNSVDVRNVKICVRYLGDHEVGMSIVDAGVFSGYNPMEEDLKALVKTKKGPIDRYELLGRGVVFYLGTVPRAAPYCFNFRIMQDFIVGNTQTSVIKAYDFYNPEESCTLFYRPDNNSPLLRKLCSGGICQCAEGGCPSKNPFINISKSQLISMACEDHDYVWKGRVLDNVQKKDGFLRIRFRVDEVLKEGIETIAEVEGEVRNLLARDNCETGELIPGRDYLIMGKDGAKYEYEEGGYWYRYLLDKSSKIHIWLSLENTKTSSERGIQRGLLWLSKKLKEKGCDL